MTAARRGAAAALLLAAGAARASAPVVLTQAAVPQYAQVVEGIRRVAPAAEAIDGGDAAAVDAALQAAPEVIVAVGSKAYDVARARGGAAAIVAAAVLGPDVAGRRDVSAVPMEARGADAIEALLALEPRARRILVLHPPGAAQAVADAQAAGRRAGVELDVRALDELDGFQGAFRSMLKGHDAVWLLPDPRLARPEIVKFMVSACLEERVPLVGFLEGMTRAGALLSVSADFPAIGREAARLAADLAQRPGGERSLPFRFVPGRISVNDRTREALALPGTPPPRAEVIR